MLVGVAPVAAVRSRASSAPSSRRSAPPAPVEVRNPRALAKFSMAEGLQKQYPERRTSQARPEHAEPRVPARDCRVQPSNTPPACVRAVAATVSPPPPDVRAAATRRRWSDRTRPRPRESPGNRTRPARAHARRHALQGRRECRVLRALQRWSAQWRRPGCLAEHRCVPPRHGWSRTAMPRLRRRCAAAPASRATDVRCTGSPAQQRPWRRSWMTRLSACGCDFVTIQLNGKLTTPS